MNSVAGVGAGTCHKSRLGTYQSHQLSLQEMGSTQLVNSKLCCRRSLTDGVVLVVQLEDTAATPLELCTHHTPELARTA